MFQESSDCGACVTRVGVLEDCAVYIESGEVSVECSFKLVGSWVVAFLVPSELPQQQSHATQEIHAGGIALA